MKKIISFICLVFILFSQLSSVNATQSSVQLYSQYAYLYDRETSLVYIDQKSDERIFPASMTKILTVHLALEKIQNLQETVIITEQDYKGLIEEGATTAGFAIGEKVTYEDLLYGALLPSGAEACQALARLTYGNIDNFVNAMNEKVKALGLQDTHFMNVTGLHDEQHYTTVREMAMILNEALDNEEFVKVFETRTHKSSNGQHNWVSSLQRGKDYKNIDVSHIDGGKSGYTDEAQLTFASTMTIDNHQLILVTAKADGIYTQHHVEDAVRVYQYMNQHFHNIVLYKKDEEIDSIWILKSFQGRYHAKAQQDISFLADKTIEKSDLEIQININKWKEAPIKEGEDLATIVVNYQGEPIYKYVETMPETIQSSILAVALHYILIGGVPFFLIVIIIWKIRQKHNHI